ncbi:MAG TPA: SCO family protein [Solirubrobacteraceae bacterium]|nr:SCO family protein [Solirubrobacteraceae bacterium]
MPGMSTGLEASDPTVVSAFHEALLRQGLVIVAIVLLIGLAWMVLRTLQLAQDGGAGTAPREAARGARASAFAEAPARRLLRIGFGLLWLLDGYLQTQPAMPLGMGPDVIQPAAASSPAWVQHLDNSLVTVWSYHPIPAAAAAVWIQIGIGAWLLAAPRGYWSRLGGVASVLWGLIVWVFGEAFGGIFAPELTWLFGAPGAALLYCVAGALVALPETAWSTRRTGRALLRGTGAFLLGMALLQAWPGRGFWHGQPHAGSNAGALTAMVREMAETSQPHFLSSLLASFGDFTAAHGLEVNLFAVIALAALGAAFVSARPRAVRAAAIGGSLLCLVDWVLIEDLGFFGGVGTDPNSMIPMALLFVAGYVAIARLPAPVPARAPRAARARGVRAAALRPGTAATPSPGQPAAALSPPRPAAELSPGAPSPRPVLAFRSLAAAAALAVTLVGAVPMAVAATERQADPIIAEAVDGGADQVNLAARPFTLVDQHGRGVTLASLRGKAVALTFLDDVCTSVCPVIAQEFRNADELLGAQAKRVEMVAVNANPRYLAPDYLVAFDRQEHLERLPNWRYLTGSLAQLRYVWRAYGATVEYSGGGAMIDHSEYADVIDAQGRIRYVLDSDPGPATEASRSSFSVTLANALKGALRSS